MSALFAAAVLACHAAVLPALAHAADAAALAESLARCNEQESNFQRLECYDAVTAKLIHTAPRVIAPAEKTAAAVPTAVPAAETSAPALPPGTVEILSRREVERKKGAALRPRLIILCGASPSASIIVGAPLGAAKVSVNTRVDREAVIKQSWPVTSDRNGVVVPQVREFINRLGGAAVLEVKITPKKQAPIPFSFDVAGLTARCIPPPAPNKKKR